MASPSVKEAQSQRLLSAGGVVLGVGVAALPIPKETHLLTAGVVGVAAGAEVGEVDSSLVFEIRLLLPIRAWSSQQC